MHTHGLTTATSSGAWRVAGPLTSGVLHTPACPTTNRNNERCWCMLLRKEDPCTPVGAAGRFMATHMHKHHHGVHSCYKDQHTPTGLATCWLSHHQPASHLQQCAPMWAHHVCIGPIQGPPLSAPVTLQPLLGWQVCPPQAAATPPMMLLLSGLGVPCSLCLARCSLHHTM
jgi:hypothetical protein